MTSTLRVATDVGGTFTDLVAFEIAADGTTTIRTAKSDTTPPNFEQGVIDVIDKAGIDPPPSISSPTAPPSSSTP